jgi:hypothetical protein
MDQTIFSLYQSEETENSTNDNQIHVLNRLPIFQPNIFETSPSLESKTSTASVLPALKLWNPAFDEFQFGISPQTVASYLPKPISLNWETLPQAFEYKHDLVKFYFLPLNEFGDQITKFIPPNTTIHAGSFICFLFFNQKLFHISLRFFHDEVHRHYNEMVEAYARLVNTSLRECEQGKEFYYEDNRIIYFSCFHPGHQYTCIDMIQRDQTTSTDGHWFNLPSFHHSLRAPTIEPIIQSQVNKKYDIMISYCHKDKELCHRLYYRLLESKFRVWIDLDNMYGPIVERMSEAIENAEFALICMSDAYKSSTYCRLEAEYAFKFQSAMIPIVVKKVFTHTGWLGMLCGLRLYIDFTKMTFDAAYEKLLTEITRYRTQASENIHSSE